MLADLKVQNQKQQNTGFSACITYQMKDFIRAE